MTASFTEVLEIVAQTDPGRVREHNEDSVFSDTNRGLVILADGLGGYNAGEVASTMATTVLPTEMEKIFTAGETDDCIPDNVLYAHAVIRAHIARVNAAIYSAAATNPKYAGMGTTIVAALFHGNRVTVAHVGDSRLYRLRGGVLVQLTRDHSVLQEQIDAGMISVADARYAKNRNLVTRALGISPKVEAEVHDYDVRKGDIYLLCSDGLNEMVEDAVTAKTLQKNSRNLAFAAEQLVKVANDNGGRDNVSVILIKVLQEFPAAKSGWRQLMGGRK